MECRSCGHDVTWVADYCAQCGTSTRPELDLRTDDGADEVSISAPADHDQAAVDQPRTGRSWLAPVASLVAVAAVAWTLLGPAGSSQPDDDVSPEEGASVASSSTTAPTSTLRTSTSTSPTSATGEPIADGVTLGDIGLPVMTLVQGAAPAAGTPLLAEPTGLALVVGGAGQPLRRLDLDTGRWSNHAATGTPLLVSGNWLVLSDVWGQVTGAIPIDDLDGEVWWDLSPGAGSGSTPAVAPGPVPGQVWVLHGPDGTDGLGFTWLLVDLDQELGQEEVVARVAVDAWTQPVPSGPGPWVMGGPEVVTSAAQGVFALAAVPPGSAPEAVATFTRVAEGRLVGVGPGSGPVLTETCDAPTRCTYRWLERDTWVEVDRGELPPRIDEVWFLSPEGRILVTLDYRSGPRVIDLDQGLVVPAAVAGVVQPSASPDGRLFLADTALGFDLTDLDTGATHPIPALGSGLRAVFVSSTG